MKKAITLTCAILAACSTVEKRTKWSDKTMRIMIDPDSVRIDDYVRLQHALVESGKWTVVDRAIGFKAVKLEQDREHLEERGRYEDAQKWAMWGKMYGVGGIVVANAQCQTEGTWLTHTPYLKCLQTLTLVDSNTAEVIVSVSQFKEGEPNQKYIAPSWDDIVYSMNTSYPKDFKSVQYVERLQNYMKDAAEAAKKDEPAPKSVIPTISDKDL